ncbi:hypothetical protein BH20GEM2_BH20GEM2_01560 [soil metagenome]
MTEKRFCSRCGSRLPDHEPSCPRWEEPAEGLGSAPYDPQATWEGERSPLPFDSVVRVPPRDPGSGASAVNERELQLIRERLLEERARTGVTPPRKAARKRRSLRTGIAALAAAAIAAVLLWSPRKSTPDFFAGTAEQTSRDVPEVAGVRDVRDGDELPLEEPAAVPRSLEEEAPGAAETDGAGATAAPRRSSAGRPPAPERREAAAAASAGSPAAASAGEMDSAGEPRADRSLAATSKPVAAVARSAAPDPSGGATAAARTQIRAAVVGYARAVESRDVRQLRRLYPQLPRREEQNWREFFGSVRNLEATLNVATLDVLDVANSTAVVRVTGTYSYRNETLGRDERSPVDFEATLRRGSGGWFFSSVR